MLYSIDENGDKIIHTMYEGYGMQTSATLFPSSDAAGTKKLLKKAKGAPKGKLQHMYKTINNAMIIRAIFYSFLSKLLLRVAQGDIFVFPGKTGSSICLKQIPDKEVKLLRQRGRYSNYDLIRADFKIPRFVLDFGPNSLKRDVQIYPGRALIKIAHKQAIERKLSWINIPKRRQRYD